MLKSIPFLIGLRYILARKNNRVISFTSLISMAGLTLGVLAIIVVLSVYNGSQGVMRERTLITVSHGEISTLTAFPDWESGLSVLQGYPGISGVAPYVSLEGMLSQQGYHQVTEIKGISPEAEINVSAIADNMVDGELEDLVPGENGIILGRVLAGNLRLNRGDAVNLVVPAIQDNNRLKLEMHRFTVKGIFDPRFSIGSELALVHIDDTAGLLAGGELSANIQYRLKVPDPDEARAVVASSVLLLDQTFPDVGFSGRDWSVTEASLFNALKMEKLLTWFMLMMIVAIGAFNIISTLVMLVSDKKADIAILRTMGAGEKTIMAIFVVQGTLVGILGTAAGALLGVLIVSNFSGITASLDGFVAPASLYVISALLATLDSTDVWITCVIALGISFIATLYPALKASQILPAEVLRYE